MDIVLAGDPLAQLPRDQRLQDPDGRGGQRDGLHPQASGGLCGRLPEQAPGGLCGRLPEQHPGGHPQHAQHPGGLCDGLPQQALGAHPLRHPVQHPEGVPHAEVQVTQKAQIEPLRTPTFTRPINRQQCAALHRGAPLAKERWRVLHSIARADPAKWTLLEIFAGKATLSLMARQQGWEVLHPQDVELGGLDLKKEEHRALLQDLIESQEPDVVTLSPRCGPWSPWQRLRKNRKRLREEREEERPIWALVEWIWNFQTSRGALAVLEQPQQSEALKLPEMARRKEVYEKIIDQCAVDLKDVVSGRPHKKSTAIQANHPSILAWIDLKCPHEPGQHQPIEGAVSIVDEQGNPKTVRRSTLAATWTPQLCQWLLDGISFSLEMMAGIVPEPAVDQPFRLHQETQGQRVWNTVPVETEANPDALLRQQLAQQADFKTKYDYITFKGASASLSRQFRNNLAHLHVCLGHIGQEKLCRMMALNGAKDVVLQAIKDLDCQICRQVQSPTPAPKAAFARPTTFNQRVVMDSFFVWDANDFKYAVTHMVDAFSLYQIAWASVNPSAAATTHLVRDKWIAIFGPPQTIMSDGGTEFGGSLEMLLRTFQVYHDIVPPTAHWRMALAERHGAVLKLMIMKVVKEKSIMGIDELQSAVVASTAARNMQARVSGFSPMQLVLGRENPLPGNLMDAMEHGYLHYQISDPLSIEDSFRGSLDIRRSAEQAFQWIQSNEALRRAATSRARLPKLEMLVEGSLVMFWEPPPNRRGLARRLQDDVSWVGPAMVVAIERKEGAIKRVWVRYRNKLKGFPLEFIRLAVAEEIQAQDINMEAFKDMEQQIDTGRVVQVTVPDPPQITDPKYQIMEFSDEEHPEHQDAKLGASSLDDVPISVHQKLKSTEGGESSAAPKKQRLGPPGDPATWPFPDRKQVFQPKESTTQAAQRTKAHLQAMREKLQPQTQPAKRPRRARAASLPPSTVEPSAGAHLASPADTFVTLHPKEDPMLPEAAESEAATDDEVVSTGFTPLVHETSPYGLVLGPNRLANISLQRFIQRFVDEGSGRPNLENLPASPNTTLRVPRHYKRLPRMPSHMARPFDEVDAAELHAAWRRNEGDFWMLRPQQQELWRVHKTSRYLMFMPDNPEEQVGPMPEGVDYTWFRGPRSTVVYTNNGVELIVDDFKWADWNPTQHLIRPWVGVTRFWIGPKEIRHAILATWIDERMELERLWRGGQCLQQTWMHRDLIPKDKIEASTWDVKWIDVFTMQSEINDMMLAFPDRHGLDDPEPMEMDVGYQELNDDVQDLPTGKMRLELKWAALSPAWQKAFEEPIKEAIKVYFQYDAVAPVMEGEDLTSANVMPSRFVLVNKTDPKNCNPEDDKIEGSRLKARWVVAGHRDAEAGLWETEAPTASLLAHNCLCFFAVQFGWKMFFGDISAAFLQGENLDPKRVVYVAIPKGYSSFVQEYLKTLLPPHARTDVVQFIKGGFGLAESPRLWFKKLQRTVKKLGAHEWALIPGVFSFFQEGRVVAMLACHVDDIRMVGHPVDAQHIWDKLKQEFTFGEWRDARDDWVKFCGRYERQCEDGSIEVQMDEYSQKVEFPPKRQRPAGHRDQLENKLTPKEKKWIGHICGQLNWLARQCRGDLLFGVSRVQQLAGVDDPVALEELTILVERAKNPQRIKFTKLGCHVDEMVILAASDASFGGMPRGRSQGGGVVLAANPKVLDGPATSIPLFFQSGLIKRVVRSSLAAEISQAADTMEQADFVRAVLAEATKEDFSLNCWLGYVSQWRLLSVLDSRTGYDLLMGANHGEDKRLAIDIAAMKQALFEDGGSRMVRWVPGHEHVADDLTKLIGNGRLAEVLSQNLWSLKDNDQAKELRSDAAARKRRYRQKVLEERSALEKGRRLQRG